MTDTAVRRPALTPEQLTALKQRGNRRTGLYLATVVAGAVAAVAAVRLVPHPLTWALAFVALGVMHHQLLIVQHEAIHSLLFTSVRWNDAAGRLVGYSIGLPWSYRLVHFRHHQLLGAPGDPDAPNYDPYPSQPAFLLRDLIGCLIGWAALRQFLGSLLGPKVPTAGKAPRLIVELAGMAGVQLGLWGLFAVTTAWWWYWALWIAPLLTIGKTLAHFRNVVEHTPVAGVPDPEMARMRTVHCNWLERILFAPMNFNFHAEHHLYPSIPYHQLPRAHRLLSDQPPYASGIDVANGYVRFLLTRAIRPSA